MSPDALRERLATQGWAVIELDELAQVRLATPWLLVDTLLGEPPMLLEVQPIRAIAHARSFAASQDAAPLHTDAQLWHARPPELQLTACMHASTSGGTSLLVDTWAVLDRLHRDDPPLARALLEHARRIPFVFGDVLGATAAMRGGRPCVVLGPHVPAGDAIGEAFARAIATAPCARVLLRPGQALLLDNHRVVHGREAFDDPRRTLVRVLAWLDRPLGSPPPWQPHAERVAARVQARLAQAPADVRRACGVPVDPPLTRDDRLVLAMLAGAPPGALARRHGIDEPGLYRLRARWLARAPSPAPAAATMAVEAVLAQLNAP